MDLNVLAQTKTEGSTRSPAMAAKLNAQNRRDDLLGVACSLGCAIHCAAMPVLASFLPVFTSNTLLSDPLLHQVLALVCTVLVARSIVAGYLSHRKRSVAAAATVGVTLLLVTAFVLPHYCASSPGPAVAMAGDVQVAPIHKHLSSTLLTDYSMRDLLGSSLAGALSALAPYLTPIGGLLLVFAHGYNIRLLGCKDRGCRCS